MGHSKYAVYRVRAGPAMPMPERMAAAIAIRARAGHLVLVVGALVGTVHFLLPQGSTAQAAVYQLAGILAAVAVVAAVRYHRPAARTHWLLLAGALGLWTLGDAIFSFYSVVLGTEAPFPSVADVPYLAGYVLAAITMWRLVRSRARLEVEGVLTGAIVAVAFGLALWTMLIEPSAAASSSSVLAVALAIAYPTLDLLLLVALAQLAFTMGRHDNAFRALLLGGVVLFAVDTLYGLKSLDGSYVGGSWVDGGWLLSYTLWAAAAWYPSMKRLHEHHVSRSPRARWLRFGTLATVALAGPIVYLIQSNRTEELVLLAGGTVATLLLVFARMALLFREHAPPRLRWVRQRNAPLWRTSANSWSARCWRRRSWRRSARSRPASHTTSTTCCSQSAVRRRSRATVQTATQACGHSSARSRPASAAVPASRDSSCRSATATTATTRFWR